MTTNSKPTVKLTRKQKAFADTLLSNPLASGTDAALATYNTKDKVTAGAISYENLRKPQIQQYLELHANTALQDNLEIAKYSKMYGDTGTKEGAAYAGVAVSINKDIQDRAWGKARQQVDINSTSVSLTIDLTSSLTEVSE